MRCFARRTASVPCCSTRIGIGEAAVIQLLVSAVTKLPRVDGDQEVRPSQRLVRMLGQAEALMGKRGDQYLSTEHLILAYLADKNQSLAGELLRMGLTPEQLEQAIHDLRAGQPINSENPEGTMDALEKYALNLNEAARKGKLDPVIGRDEEIRRIMQVLSRRSKNNPILIGEPGVGKTAIVEGLAGKIVAGEVRTVSCKKKSILWIWGSMIAGAKYRGEFEDRF